MRFGLTHLQARASEAGGNEVSALCCSFGLVSCQAVSVNIVAAEGAVAEGAAPEGAVAEGAVAEGAVAEGAVAEGAAAAEAAEVTSCTRLLIDLCCADCCRPGAPMVSDWRDCSPQDPSDFILKLGRLLQGRVASRTFENANGVDMLYYATINKVEMTDEGKLQFDITYTDDTEDTFTIEDMIIGLEQINWDETLPPPEVFEERQWQDSAQCKVYCTQLQLELGQQEQKFQTGCNSREQKVIPMTHAFEMTDDAVIANLSKMIAGTMLHLKLPGSRKPEPAIVLRAQPEVCVGGLLNDCAHRSSSGISTCVVMSSALDERAATTGSTSYVSTKCLKLRPSRPTSSRCSSRQITL